MHVCGVCVSMCVYVCVCVCVNACNENVDVQIKSESSTIYFEDAKHMK